MYKMYVYGIDTISQSHVLKLLKLSGNLWPTGSQLVIAATQLLSSLDSYSSSHGIQ